MLGVLVDKLHVNGNDGKDAQEGAILVEDFI